MLLELRKHDGTDEVIEVLGSNLAQEIVTSIDWDAERRRFEQLVESEDEAFFPSIAFTNDCFRTLELGPNSDDTFWISYRYSVLKSTFGFTSVIQEREQRLQECELAIALGLLERHYAGKHQEIVALLPTENISEDWREAE